MDSDFIDEIVNEIMENEPEENKTKLKNVIVHMVNTYDEKAILEMLNDVDNMSSKSFFKKHCLPKNKK
jgi:hypothetical protein